jgi:CO/xanthine dehydrogenase FAD-binding subunit
MIIEYHRPKTIDEALELLARVRPVTYALGGGTFLNREREEQYAVVDLQSLDIGKIKISGNQAQLGATSKLQEILDFPGLPGGLYIAIKLEDTYNLRQMKTIAGALVTANGRSPIATVMLALDASLEILAQGAEPQRVKLGDWLPVRSQAKPGKLIRMLTFSTAVKIAYEYVARSPADQPIVGVATAQWSSGRTRVALGGWGSTPLLAMDGPEAAGIETAARNAYSHAEDEWASAEYRQEVAGVLAARSLEDIRNAT